MKFVTTVELKQIGRVCEALQKIDDVIFAGNVYDANGELLGVVEITDGGEYGFVLGKEYVEK